MTNKEKIMYEIITSFSDSNIPLVFKGGLITKLVLSENKFDEIERGTRDIDASWIGKPPTMNEMRDTISYCLKRVNEDYEAVVAHEYKENRSAGINIIQRSTDEKITSMDIDVKPCLGERLYYIGEASIRGVLVDEIIMDKIYALAGHTPFSCTKNMIDIYALSQCVEVRTKNIFLAFEKAGRSCGDFQPYLTRTEDIRHSYEKLKVTKGSLPFEKVHGYLNNFFSPFMIKDLKANKIWNSNNIRWEDVLEQDCTNGNIGKAK